MSGRPAVELGLRRRRVRITGRAGLRGGHPVVSRAFGDRLDANRAGLGALGSAGLGLGPVPASQHQRHGPVGNAIGSRPI